MLLLLPGESTGLLVSADIFVEKSVSHCILKADIGDLLHSGANLSGKHFFLLVLVLTTP